jgi:hypothetical protein
VNDDFGLVNEGQSRGRCFYSRIHFAIIENEGLNGSSKQPFEINGDCEIMHEPNKCSLNGCLHFYPIDKNIYK